MDLLKEKLLAEGYTEDDDAMLFAYANWWLGSNFYLPEDTLWEIFQSSFGYHMYLDRGYVIVEDE